MKAISLHQPWANLIRDGKKKIETRFWPTKYRGDLVICSTKNPREGEGPFGYALCIVEILHCRPMEKLDEDKACIEYLPERYSWILSNLRVIKEPFAVKGRQGFFNIEIPPDGKEKLRL